MVILEELRKDLGIATLGSTRPGTITAAEARRMACNATIIPWVLGGDSEVLDAGRGTGSSSRSNAKHSGCSRSAAKPRAATPQQPGPRLIT